MYLNISGEKLGSPLKWSTSPSVSVSPTSGNYCAGSTPVALTASGASTYAWSPATGLNATTGATVNASPTANTTYTVTGTDGNGCTATATAAVTYSLNLTSLTASATPASICSGGTSVLNSATNTGIAMTDNSTVGSRLGYDPHAFNVGMRHSF